MTATSALPTSPPTTDVRECSACRQPLGSASRYCLHCGARRGPAPLELVGLVSPTVAPRPARTAAPAGLAAADGLPTAHARVPPPAPATVLPAAASGAAGRGWPFALTAVVLLALVIGLLAGGWLADRRDDPGSGSGTAISTAAPASTPGVSTPAAVSPPPTAPAGPATGAGE